MGFRILVLVVTAVSARVQFGGVNLAGADFGSPPGTIGVDYAYPTPDEVDYFVGKGMNIFRVPFLWERMQTSQFADLDQQELQRLVDIVDYATSHGASVLIDPHNYARYFDAVVGQDVSVDIFSDFWTKLANEFKDNEKVIFGLMNEPNTMPTETWLSDANAAISAIRSTGANNLITVPGNAWTGAHSWLEDWYGTSNGDVMKNVVDPKNNFVFEVHQYLDADFSGTSDTCASTTVGSEQLQTFTQWARDNGFKAILGEFGGGRNDVCEQALDDMLGFMDSNTDVWTGWTYWAAGPLWGDYIFTLEPSNGQDRPQLASLTPHLQSQTSSEQSVDTQSIDVQSEPVVLSSSNNAATVQFGGVNLAGAEFGSLPGTFGSDYAYPTTQEVDYFVGKGMNIFRIPFAWERLQPSQFSDLDQAEIQRLTDIVTYATSQGAFVLIDPHNYARYFDAVVGIDVSVDIFSDLWTKLANVFKSNDRVVFGLMNEPNTMPTETWLNDANAAISAIRATGATNLITIPGNAWTGAHSWLEDWYGTSNGDVMKNVVDPANNFIFEVHQYLDSDFSGTTDSCVSTTVGSEQLQTFTQWARDNGFRAVLGEFGGGRNSVCEQALDDMLAFIDSNTDVWAGWTYWAAGPLWGDYIFTLEPDNGQDRPQLASLTPHLGFSDNEASIPASETFKDGFIAGAVILTLLVISFYLFARRRHKNPTAQSRLDDAEYIHLSEI